MTTKQQVIDILNEYNQPPIPSVFYPALIDAMIRFRNLPAPSSATVNGDVVEDLKKVIIELEDYGIVGTIYPILRQAIHALSNGSEEKIYLDKNPAALPSYDIPSNATIEDFKFHPKIQPPVANDAGNYRHLTNGDLKAAQQAILCNMKDAVMNDNYILDYLTDLNPKSK